ncbi:unnamed protein product, partial [Pocillopora meandrina]
MNAETHMPESRVKIAQNAETQTTEFEYLFKQAVLQPFIEKYFANNDERVRFYTGLPGLMRSKQLFLSSVCSGKSLSLFQEIVMVLIKLRLNVPLQDLAYRFG